MITIRPVYNEFKITFSNPGSGWRGYSVMARDIPEVHRALDHYHRTGDHKGTWQPSDNCPLCRLEKEQASKRRK